MRTEGGASQGLASSIHAVTSASGEAVAIAGPLICIEQAMNARARALARTGAESLKRAASN